MNFGPAKHHRRSIRDYAEGGLHFGSGLRGRGNSALWNAEKIGILCSRNGVPDRGKIPQVDVYLG